MPAGAVVLPGSPFPRKALHQMSHVNYSLTIRAAIRAEIGMLGRVLAAIGDQDGLVGGVDIVHSSPSAVTRDITVLARDQEHGEAIRDAVAAIDGVTIEHATDRVVLAHTGGSIGMRNRVPLVNRDDLSMAYTPGVARVCMAIHDDAYILVASARIQTFDEILPVLEAFARNRKPLIVIASEVAGEALATLVVNRRKADALVCAVSAPGTGSWKDRNLADIAAATGATLIGDESGHRLADIKPAMVGRARRVEIGRSATTIVGGGADPQLLQARLVAVRADIAGARYLAYDREQHELRLARLAGAIATVRVGAPTRSELDQRLSAAKRAVAATASARRGGVVAGGGAALLHAAAQAARVTIGDGTERAAAGVLERALAAPLRAIVANRGRDASYMAGLVAASSNDAEGFDAVADQYGGLIAAGVVDACELTVEALLRAISTATTLASVAAATVSAAGPNDRRGAA